MNLNLEIITPEKKIFEGAVSYVYLPGEDGEIGVLPQHECVVTALKPGELRYEHEAVQHVFAIGSGVAEITQEKVVVLTDMAQGEAEIDVAQTEAALQRANEQLKNISPSANQEEVAALHNIIAKSTIAINLKRKHRN